VVVVTCCFYCHVWLLWFSGRSDLCFHVVRDNRVLNADTALDAFEARERTSPTLREIYKNYTVIDVKVRDCLADA